MNIETNNPTSGAEFFDSPAWRVFCLWPQLMGQGGMGVWATHPAITDYTPLGWGKEVTTLVNELLIPLILSLTAAGTTVAATWKILASVIG
ncbi:MAG: hypothetical protein K8L91_19780, partial [Anaerolineae bacterium]|nr:hypothetical protein [Anaerolineae bacterium]